MRKELRRVHQRGGLRRFLRMKELPPITGRSRSWIYEAIRRDEFPAPISIGARSVAWTEESIAEWQEQCVEQSRKTGKEDQ
jgi:prophage regulatory protein